MTLQSRVQSSNLLFSFLFHSNRKFAHFYTGNLIRNTKDELLSKYEEMLDLWRLLADLMDHKELKVKCLRSFSGRMRFGYRVVQDLQRFLGYNLHLHDKTAGDSRSISEAFEMLKKLVDELKTTSTDGQTFAFKYFSVIDVYYARAIVLPRELKYLEEGRLDPDTKRILHYDLVMPFNNPNHNDHNCVKAVDLTRFYKSKGKGWWE